MYGKLLENNPRNSIFIHDIFIMIYFLLGVASKFEKCKFEMSLNSNFQNNNILGMPFLLTKCLRPLCTFVRIKTKQKQTEVFVYSLIQNFFHKKQAQWQCPSNRFYIKL